MLNEREWLRPQKGRPVVIDDTERDPDFIDDWHTITGELMAFLEQSSASIRRRLD